VRLKWFKRSLAVLLLLALLAGVAWLGRAPLLRGVARAWVVNDPPAKADVIVVMGGGLSTRPFAAARLFHQGLAPKILLTNPQSAPSVPPGLIPADADVGRTILLNEAVPAADIFVTADRVSSTYEEALAVRAWAATNGVKRILIPTDIFHTRRVRWVFGKALRSTGIQVQVQAVPVREYAQTNWWQHEQGIVAFQNELLKYAYYRMKY